jgi:hypothetical protein
LRQCGFACSVFVALTAESAGAIAQTSLRQDPDIDGGALDFFRPPPNLFQAMTEYKTAPGSSSTPGSTREVTTETFNLRYDHAFNLASGWILATRTDLPLLAKNAISDSNLNGDYVRGIGDADVQAALIHGINQRWAFGFGMRLIAPTGDDVLGSGKWQVMPIVGARLALPEITSGSYFEPVFRYDVSVAGDPTRKNISNLQFAPMLNIALAGPMVCHAVPKPGYPHQLRRSDHGTDRPLVRPVRLPVRQEIHREYRAVAGVRRAHRQGLPGL